jgi:HEAT repeat protein
VTAEIALAPTASGAGPPLREAATATVPLPGGGLAREGWLGALKQATQRAAEALALAVAAAEKPEGALLADVSAKDPRVREHAIRSLGERRARAAVPVLVERLKEEEPRLAHRIVGALAQIGDERAVPALIDVSRGGDAAVAARIARHIGDIGGPEAEGYLLTLASGHADPRVRRAAREALDDMSARAHEASLAARK